MGIDTLDEKAGTNSRNAANHDLESGNVPATEAERGNDASCDNNDGCNGDETAKHVSAFKRLGILDRFLAVWIFLAMAVGIILGNFVPNTGPALQKGKFVGVSIPVGKLFMMFESPSRDYDLALSVDFPLRC